MDLEQEDTVDVAVAADNVDMDLKKLRAAIPEHCFQPSLFTSLQYVVRDLTLMSILFYLATLLTSWEPSVLRTVLWISYGIIQGMVFTGIWILAHECGHDAFSTHRRTNAGIGFVLHSILMVPFFSWKFSHSRHHRYTNHMEKDTVFVPSRKTEFRTSTFTGEILGHAGDAPIVSMALFLGHQLLGWPLYMLLNAGAGAKSLADSDRSKSLRQSHLDPASPLFSSREKPLVLLSNIGLMVMFCILVYASKFVGRTNMLLIYGMPYLWMNHWLVAITFLHHTHPDVPHYEENAWTYQKGAMSTVDRDFGFIGRHLFHGIIEYHVVHHMFSKIPFYHAEEATEAIRPLLGKAYVEQRTSFVRDLWSTFVACDYVQEHSELAGRMLWCRANGEKH